MPSIALKRSDVIVGVDTHKDEHVAVAIDGLGGIIDEPRFVPATNDGYGQLLDWAVGLGQVHAFGVEGCGSYGSGLAKFLRRHDQLVREIARPPRRGERRASGKSDTIDAEHAARVVLSGSGTATPKLANGQVEAIRVIKIARNTAVKAHTTAIITLKAVLVTAPDELRETLEPLTDHRLILACAGLACAGLDSDGDMADPAVAIRHSLASLARRYLDLHEEIKTHSNHLKQLIAAAAPQMLERFGVGFDTAAEMLMAAGDNTNRVPLRSRVRETLRRLPHPRRIGQDQRPPPPQPRRQPQSQRRSLPSRHRPHAMAPTHHRPRRTPNYPRPHQTRHHPMPQTIRCTRALPTPPQTLNPAQPGDDPDRDLTIYRSINAMAESVIGLFKTELHRNPAALATNGGPWRGLNDLEIATCGWVSWFNDQRVHGELDDLTPAEIEQAHYRDKSQPIAA